MLVKVCVSKSFHNSQIILVKLSETPDLYATKIGHDIIVIFYTPHNQSVLL